MRRAAIVLLLVVFAAAPARADVRDVEVHPGSGLGEPQIHINPKDPSNLVVGENDSGVSVSRDGGATWKQVSLPNPGDNVLAVEPSGTFLYSALDGHVRASSDGGTTWTTVGNWVGQVAQQAQATGDNGAG